MDHSQPIADEDVHDIIMNDPEATKRLLDAIFSAPECSNPECPEFGGCGGKCVRALELSLVYECNDLDCAACEWAARHPIGCGEPGGCTGRCKDV
jgi:hypothetical protein